MAYSDFNSTSDSNQFQHVLSSIQGEPVSLPTGFIAAQNGFIREGNDLVISGTNDETILLQNFYSEQPSGIELGAGFMSYQMVGRLAGALNPGEYAQITPFTASNTIGLIETSEGSVTAVHADGTTVVLQVGSSVFQGDVIRTAEGANVGITFKDESTFSLDESGEIILDEMVYDPDTGEGAFASTVTTGVFSFISGQIAKVNPDAMSITTPVATIGIRGTKGQLKVTENGATETALLSEPGGATGELVLTNGAGTIILNQPNQYSAILSFTSGPSQPVILSNIQITGAFGTRSLRSLNSAKKASTERKATQKQEEADAEEADAIAAEEAAIVATEEAQVLAAQAEAAAAAAENAEGEEAILLLAEAEALAAAAAEAETAAIEASALATEAAIVAEAAAAEAAAAAIEAVTMAQEQAAFESQVAAIEQSINQIVATINQNTPINANEPAGTQEVTVDFQDFFVELNNLVNDFTETLVADDFFDEALLLEEDLFIDAGISEEPIDADIPSGTIPSRTSVIDDWIINDYYGDPIDNTGNIIDGDVVLSGSNDAVAGLSGDDVIDTYAGDDVISGGAGHDVIYGGTGSDIIHGDTPTISGNFFDFTDNFGDIGLSSDTGDDVICGEGGLDIIDGGNGNDLLFADFGLFNGSTYTRQAKNTTFAETINGGEGNDTIHGEDGDDLLSGDAGNDIIYGYQGADAIDGGGGSDTIDGGGGSDTMTGGTGADTFKYYYEASFGDNITDFVSGTDHIIIDAGADIQNIGQLAQGVQQSIETSSTVPTDASSSSGLATLIFFNDGVADSTYTALYYDPDGNGTTYQSTKIAEFQNDAVIVASDITLTGSI